MTTSPSSGSRLRRLAAATTIAQLLLVLSAAAAPTPDRAGYVTRLESICRPSVAATQRAVRGLAPDIQAERIAVAAGKVGRADRIFEETVRRMSAVRRPGADASQLAKWFGYLHRQESYLSAAAAALRAKQVVAYQHDTVRFIHNGNLANDVVIAYGFNYCRFNFHRFS